MSHLQIIQIIDTTTLKGSKWKSDPNYVAHLKII